MAVARAGIDASGQARATWTLGTGSGANALAARASGLGGSPVAFQATGVAGAPAALAKVSGDGQSGPVAGALAQPLVVKVTDVHGNPVGGASVTWSITGGGGAISPAIVTSDDQGEARGTWTLGTVVGANTASAAAAGASVAFSASATPGAAATLLKISGEGQSGPAGAALPQPIVVRATDAYDNAVGGVTVSFAVTSGGGSLQPASAVTGANGQAQAVWTLGTTVGVQGVTAGAGGLTPVSFSATAAATTGSIEVTTQTTGQNLPGGYTVGVAGQSQSIGASGSVSFTDVQPGTQTVQLSRVPSHCTVSGGTTRQVNVTAGQTAQVSYQISCSDPGEASVYRVTLTGTVGFLSGGAQAISRSARLHILPTIPANNATPNGVNPVEVAIVTDASPLVGLAGALWFGTNTSLCVLAVSSCRLGESRIDIAFVEREGDRITVRVDGDVFGQPTARLNTFNIYNVTSSVVAQIHNVLAGEIEINLSGSQISGRLRLLGSSGFGHPAPTTFYQATFSGHLQQ